MQPGAQPRTEHIARCNRHRAVAGDLGDAVEAHHQGLGTKRSVQTPAHVALRLAHLVDVVHAGTGVRDDAIQDRHGDVQGALGRGREDGTQILGVGELHHARPALVQKLATQDADHVRMVDLRRALGVFLQLLDAIRILPDVVGDPDDDHWPGRSLRTRFVPEECA